MFTFPTGLFSGIKTTIIESFDTLTNGGANFFGTNTYIGDNTWLSGLISTTATLSSSHVTQGTHSWRVQDSSVNGQAGILTANQTTGAANANLSGYKTLYIDLYGATTPSNIHYFLSVVSSDQSNAIQENTPDNLTGSDTLVLDLTSAGFDLSSVFVSIGAETFTTAGTFDVYFDNLRAS